MSKKETNKEALRFSDKELFRAYQEKKKEALQQTNINSK